MVDLLVACGDDRAADKKTSEAVALYRQALPIATGVGSSRTKEIMDKINPEWEKEEIKNIYFAIGDIPSTPAQPADPAADFSPRLLKERDKRLIRENLSQVDDEELKAILKKVMTKEIIKRRLNE